MRALQVLLLSASLIPALVCAQDVPLRDFTYHESFEDGRDPVREWVASGDFTINSKGITDECAFDGERSFLLDVTLDDSGYFYWHVPLDVPAEGDLRFSARVLTGEGHNASAGVGLNWVFPPTHHSGCGEFESYREPTGQWRLIEADIDAEAPGRAGGVLSRWVEGATGAEVGVRLDRWGIFIRGNPGQRAVLYVDDVRIEGRVPTEAAYEAIIAQRWEPFARRWDERVATWRERLAEIERSLSDPREVPVAATPIVRQGHEALGRAREQIEAMAQRGYAHPDEVSRLEADLRMADMEHLLQRFAEAWADGERLLPLPVRAISNARILPTQVIVPITDEDELVISACRGEYESASFVVLPLSDLTGVIVRSSALRAADGSTIAPEAIDVKIVKAWYQAGSGIHDLSDRILVPELLLNDSELVRVDHEQQQNYLRSTAPDGSTSYVLCSGETSDMLEGVRPMDARRLQPVDLPAMRLQQYWVTVHVPTWAPAGEYVGALTIEDDAGESVQLPLRLTVHDFALAPPPLTYSVYYRGKLSEDNRPTITSEWRSEAQYLAEMRDMLAHGIAYPTIYQGYDERLLPRALQLRAMAGLPTERLFSLGISTGAPQTDEELEELRERVRRWQRMISRFGYGQLYVYGIDEARGERLLAQRNAWAAVQDEGAKTFVAGYHGTFEAMGSLLDVAVLAGRPDPDEAAKFHSVGSEVFTYAFPQVGPEEPETFRRNYGLVLWQANFDGAMDYAYQHGFGHVWNDFDSDRYRDHNFAYPTINGVISTVQLEGFREAVDDTRYVATLQRAIDNCGDAETAEAARKWLDELDPTRDLYEVRAEMVEHIIACRASRPVAQPDPASSDD